MFLGTRQTAINTRLWSRQDMTTSLWLGQNYEMPAAPHRVSPVFGTKVEMGKRPIDKVLASKYGAFRKWRGKDFLLEASRDIHGHDIICIFIHFRTLNREAKRSLITSQRQDHCVLNCLKHLSRLENIPSHAYMLYIRVIHNVLRLIYNSILLSILIIYAK